LNFNISFFILLSSTSNFLVFSILFYKLFAKVFNNRLKGPITVVPQLSHTCFPIAIHCCLLSLHIKILLSYTIVTYPSTRTLEFSWILIWDIVNSSDNKFRRIDIRVFFWNLSYGFLWTIFKTFPIGWSSLDISKDKFPTTTWIWKGKLTCVFSWPWYLY
jgi:hypothetical protein